MLLEALVYQSIFILVISPTERYNGIFLEEPDMPVNSLSPPFQLYRLGVSKLGYRRAAVYVSAGHRRHMLSRQIGRELPGVCVFE